MKLCIHYKYFHLAISVLLLFPLEHSCSNTAFSKEENIKEGSVVK